MRRHLVVHVVSAVVLAVVAAPGARAAEGAEPLYAFDDDQIRESSGLATSSRDDGVVFTHNDSGDGPRFFAVDDRGCTLVRYTVVGAGAVDWEDMARGPKVRGRHDLWFGDVGDNAEQRSSVTMYRVEEPRPRPASTPSSPCGPAGEAPVAATAYAFVYADGPRDAEAVFVDPRDGRVHVVSKATLPTATTGLYAAPGELRADAPNELRRIATLPLPDAPVLADDPVAALPAGVGGREVVTGADMAPDGSSVVVRTYTSAYLWQVGPDEELASAMRRPPRRVPLPSQPQGEAVVFAEDGRSLVVSSEDPLAAGPPVWRVPLPAG